MAIHINNPLNAPFLTEYITLETNQLHQRGIGLAQERKQFDHDGPYSPKLHFAWIEHQRKKCQNRGWLANDIAKYGADQIIQFSEDLIFPNHLMELIWKLTDSPTGTPFRELNIDNNKSLMINSEIQLPFIFWLNENELNRTAIRLNELVPNKNNPVGKTLWDHANLVKDVLEGWFIRKGLAIPKIEYPGAPLTKWTRFEELIQEAMACGPQSAEQLWNWKKQFAEFPSNYFTRYEEKHGSIPQGEGAGNGLEWRHNSKFRKKPDK